MKRLLEVPEAAEERSPPLFDYEPVADEIDSRCIDELLRTLERHRGLVAVDRRDPDVAGLDLDLEPDGTGSGEVLLSHRSSFQPRP